MTAHDEALEPALVWERFLELTAIPRPSREEDAVREHIREWADDRGWETDVDPAGNAVVRVPASPGREGAPLVVLQSHVDMVCERDPGSPYDSREGRIHVVRDADWILAEGTTLGADNGIGVAAAMAVADDRGVLHGPLELLFTVCEEQGLEGAKALDPALVTGRLLVNLDGTSDGAITVGCAGSAHTFAQAPLRGEPLEDGWPVFRIDVSGAQGGHSGADIHRGRINAIKALGRVLDHARAVTELRLAHLEGGASRNAIPREAHAVVAARVEQEGALRDAVASAAAELRDEHAGSDDGLEVSVENARAETAADLAATARALDLLAVLPTGVVTLAPGLERAVQTSTSLNVARTEDAQLVLASMTRSSIAAALDHVLEGIEREASSAGAELEIVRSYPPWEPDLASPLLTSARTTYRRLFGSEPGLEVVHGGLECAVIGTRLPGVRMISIGPTILGPHAPGERLSIGATKRFYRLLGALLGDLSS